MRIDYTYIGHFLVFSVHQARPVFRKQACVLIIASLLAHSRLLRKNSMIIRLLSPQLIF
jgi:hypothetical protein